MTKTNSQERKLLRKQRRCESLLAKDYSDLKFLSIDDEDSDQSRTPFLVILNAGLSTGLTEETVLKATENYGQITELIMIPNKSYCFLRCYSEQDAYDIYTNLHGRANIGQNNTVIYLSRLLQLPHLEYDENPWDKSWPPGLHLLENFITSEEEAQLLGIIESSSKDIDGGTEKTLEISGNNLKHRQVQHFGYEFLYDLNNVDIDKPMKQQIPSECDFLWKRLHDHHRNCSQQFQPPNQLTVNVYEPGQGIPPHVDTHSAFEGSIYSLSLEGDIVMDFRRRQEKVSVLLPRRSLLIMSEEARYDWTHGITPRSMDIVRTSLGRLTIQTRQKRTSFTFRRVLKCRRCECNYPRLCDSRQSEKQARKDTEQLPVQSMDEKIAPLLEEQNVHKVYDRIADHFSETRHTPWPRVMNFLRGFQIGSIVLDVGCGNGKYLQSNPSISLSIGCDRSLELLKICQRVRLNSNTFRCDCLRIPIRSNSIDGCISIAVIHHLATEERRLQAIQEMIRVLRVGGRALIYVWAKNQCANNQKSSYLRQNKAVNKLKTTPDEQRQCQSQWIQLEEESIHEQKTIITLPIHTNRTDFQDQDVFVPWKTKEKNESSQSNDKDLTTYLRYYHVFEDSELENLLQKCPDARMIESYYDQGNHCVIIEKL